MYIVSAKRSRWRGNRGKPWFSEPPPFFAQLNHCQSHHCHHQHHSLNFHHFPSYSLSSKFSEPPPFFGQLNHCHCTVITIIVNIILKEFSPFSKAFIVIKLNHHHHPHYSHTHYSSWYALTSENLCLS